MAALVLGTTFVIHGPLGRRQVPGEGYFVGWFRARSAAQDTTAAAEGHADQDYRRHLAYVPTERVAPPPEARRTTNLEAIRAGDTRAQYRGTGPTPDPFR